MTLSALHLLNLLEFAACKGLDRRELLDLLDSPEAELTDEHGRVGAEEYVRVWERIEERTGDAYLGLHFGCFLNLKALGLIYRISLASSGIEQALGLLDDYLRSTFPLVSLETGVSRAFLYLELHSPLPDGPVRNHLLDSVLFLMYREIGLMIEGEISEVQLPGGPLEEYRRSCASPVVASDRHRLKLEARLLAGPINRRRLKNIETLLPLFLQLIDQPALQNAPFADQVRKMTLSLCAPGFPTLDQVVGQFALSHRTFQRRLTEEGTSFRRITDDLKREMARHLQRGRTLGTQDIAYLLGYSGSSAYLHAARKWKQQQA